MRKHTAKSVGSSFFSFFMYFTILSFLLIIAKVSITIFLLLKFVKSQITFVIFTIKLIFHISFFLFSSSCIQLLNLLQKLLIASILCSIRWYKLLVLLHPCVYLFYRYQIWIHCSLMFLCCYLGNLFPTSILNITFCSKSFLVIYVILHCYLPLLLVCHLLCKEYDKVYLGEMSHQLLQRFQ